MRASRGLGILAASTAIALSVLCVASPASAATLPDGQRISVATSSGGPGNPELTQLYDVDPATAVGTAVGTPSNPAHPVTAIDVDDDGYGYATGIVTIDDETNAATLWVLDANTGAFTSPVTITVPMLGSDIFCPSIDYHDGQILITCNQETEETFISILGTVDPATGDVDVNIAIEDEGETYTEFSALATSPAGVLWAFGFDEVGPFAAVVDLAGETLGTRIPILNNDNEAVNGADFDRDGQLFASVDSDGGTDALATVDLTTGTVSPVAAFPFGPFGSTRAITVWGNPILPATGLTDVLPVGLGTALLLLAGAAFVATARIQRRAA